MKAAISVLVIEFSAPLWSLSKSAAAPKLTAKITAILAASSKDGLVMLPSYYLSSYGILYLDIKKLFPVPGKEIKYPAHVI